MDTITQAKTALTQAFFFNDTATTEIYTTVTSAYEELKTYLDENQLADEQLRSLEQDLDAMKTKRDSLDADLAESKEEASDLFTLLKRRAEENETEELREEMLTNIDEKADDLRAKFRAADAQIERINDSIQKFDDIVGYLQVNRGLAGIEQMTEDIDKFIAAGAEFDDEIRQQIEAGMELVEGL